MHKTVLYINLKTRRRGRRVFYKVKKISIVKAEKQSLSTFSKNLRERQKEKFHLRFEKEMDKILSNKNVHVEKRNEIHQKALKYLRYGKTKAKYGKTKAKHGKTKAKHGKTKAKHGKTKAKHGKTKVKPLVLRKTMIKNGQIVKYEEHKKPKLTVAEEIKPAFVEQLTVEEMYARYHKENAILLTLNFVTKLGGEEYLKNLHDGTRSYILYIGGVISPTEYLKRTTYDILDKVKTLKNLNV